MQLFYTYQQIIIIIIYKNTIAIILWRFKKEIIITEIKYVQIRKRQYI